MCNLIKGDLSACTSLRIDHTLDRTTVISPFGDRTTTQNFFRKSKGRSKEHSAAITQVYIQIFSPENIDLFAEAPKSSILSCMSMRSFADAFAILYFRKRDGLREDKANGFGSPYTASMAESPRYEKPSELLRAARIHPDLHIISRAFLRRHLTLLIGYLVIKTSENL